jgi:probable F420-dependent oxidoreductase
MLAYRANIRNAGMTEYAAPPGRLMRIGVKVPNTGTLPAEPGIPVLAKAFEDAGFESLWVSDHIVMPETIRSRYPFAADGKPTWPSTTPYFDAVVALALAAAATERATIGTAVLVLPLRHPIVLAKQVASIDVASRGRLVLGVSAGWLREEFQALDAPFERRGAQLDESIAIARECWSGRVRGDILCLPTPAHEIPLLIGGHSDAALRRAGRLADGWLPQQSLREPSVEEIRQGVAVMRAAAEQAERDPERLRVVLRLVDSAAHSDEVARQLPALAAAGVDEVIVDVPWERDDPRRAYERMREAVPAGS